MGRAFVFLLMLVLLGGCSSSRVILLENNKSGNAVVVKTTSGELLLSEPNSYTEISSSSAPPSKPKTIDKDQLNKQYHTLLTMAPKPPVSFLVYFEPDSTAMTETSQAMLSSIATAVSVRSPCVVNIIGHSDRTGSSQYNIKLSLQRANSVKQWLSEQDLEILRMNVTSYGEEDPLVPTADGVAEPKNRRVEIMIR